MSSTQDPVVIPPTDEPKLIVIDEDGDLIVGVTSPKSHNDNQKPTSVKFKVSSEILRAKSEYFSSSIRFMHQNRKLEIQLTGDSYEAMRIWFLYMHKNIVSSEATLIKETSISCIWHIISAGDKYLLDGEILKNFFIQWYTKNTHFGTDGGDGDGGYSYRPSLELACQLPLPCYMFDYAEGFAEVTKWLAYNAPGHISERRPIAFREMHLHLAPPDCVRLMNAVRGRLKTVLARDLWEPAEKVFKYCPEFECLEGRNLLHTTTSPSTMQKCIHWSSDGRKPLRKRFFVGSITLPASYTKDVPAARSTTNQWSRMPSPITVTTLTVYVSIAWDTQN